ncbi:Pyridoxamine 5'-phosphate oxidase putative domain-containing protein [[Candida] zeylanoides]
MLPESVTSLLDSTRYVHLATCQNNVPHVSLMNYTYLRDSDGDKIIITTPKNTTKFENIQANPHVSLLVHDWISAKTNKEKDGADANSSGRRNSLYELLTNLNKTEYSSVSVMLTGEAAIIDPQEEKYGFYRSLHLNNSSIDPEQAKNWVDCDTALVVITIVGCKVTDTDNNIEEYKK